jgi:ACR3 family arsenite efflux pump ArsB
MPVLLGVLTAAGLVVGLLGDGWWDAVAVAGLGIPVAVGLWHMFKPAARRR